MLLQQRRARSSIMVNIYCRMHSYIILSCIILPASASSITFLKLPCAAAQMLHCWFQFSFFPLLSPLPPLVPIQWGRRLSSVNLCATFWNNACDRGRAEPEAAHIYTAHTAQGKGAWLQTKSTISVEAGPWGSRFILFSIIWKWVGGDFKKILKLRESKYHWGKKTRMSLEFMSPSFLSFFLSLSLFLFHM